MRIRIASFFLTFFILFFSVCSPVLSVFAAGSSDDDVITVQDLENNETKAAIATRTLSYFISMVGAVFTHDVIGLCANSANYLQYLLSIGYNKDSVLLRKNGDQMVMTDAFMDTSYEYVNYFIETNQGYKYLKNSGPNSSGLLMNSLFSMLSTYTQSALQGFSFDVTNWTSLAASYDKSIILFRSNSFPSSVNAYNMTDAGVVSFSDFAVGDTYLVITADGYNIYDYHNDKFYSCSGRSVVPRQIRRFMGRASNASSIPSSVDNSEYASDFAFPIGTVTDIYLDKLSYQEMTWQSYYYLGAGTYETFTSLQEMEDYVNKDKKERTFYLSDDFVNYKTNIDNTSQVNYNTLTQTEWSEVNNTYYDTFTTNIEEGMTDEQLRTLLSQTLSGMGDIVDGAAGDIIKAIEKASNKQISVLDKIFNAIGSFKDDVKAGFSSVVEAIGKIGSSGSSETIAVDLSVLSDAFSSMDADVLIQLETSPDDARLQALHDNFIYIIGLIHSHSGEYTMIELSSFQVLLSGLSVAMGENSSGTIEFDSESLAKLLRSISENVGEIQLNQVKSDDLFAFFDDLKDLLSDHGGKLDSIHDTLLDIKHLTQADLLVDTIDAIANIIDASGASDFITSVTSSFNPLTTVMKTKFPFSLPWDTSLLIGVFAAEPETPHFEMPFQLERFGIDETFILDFADFEPLSKISRSILTLLFLLMLVWVTVKIYRFFNSQ